MTTTGQQHLVRLTALLAVFAIAQVVDREAFYLLRHPDRPKLEMSDWYQMFRSAGFLPTWVLIALAVLLHSARPTAAGLPEGWWRRGAYIAATPALSGAVGELVKHLIGRERPIHNDGFYRFKPFLHAFTDGTNLGLPSTHACVAFGGAFALIFLAPRASVIFLTVALGCVMTRLLSGAHFVSDVSAAAVVAYAVAAALRPLFLDRPARGPSLAPLAGAPRP